MSDTVIKVEGLSKKYLLRHQQGERYAYLRNLLENKVKGLFNRGIVQPVKRLSSKCANSTVKQLPSSTTEEFYALKDVSFEVKRGDRIGIIGRNGAGKSTLLKLLSRITEPTAGRVEITGRVGSLLEVGTGFHPELTGRENIFLNGAILGMKKAEIKKKFDEIVAFAEVEKFLDTPVKRFSSGMYVRLAFAVAAHLEPEILIVDEVLAVGDAQFQKKCLGKMEEVGKEGRTILFVSHNMTAMESLCERAVLLDGGHAVMDGRAGDVINRYLGDRHMKVQSYRMTAGKAPPCFAAVELIQDGRKNGTFASDRPIRISFKIDAAEAKGLDINLFIRNGEGACIHHSSDVVGGTSDLSDYEGESAERAERRCEIPAYALAAGWYHIDVSLTRRGFEVCDYLRDVLIFETGLTAATDEKTTAVHWKGVCGPGIIKWE
jgi:lipopolysaccharide transport system ATP-binding protein